MITTAVLLRFSNQPIFSKLLNLFSVLCLAQSYPDDCGKPAISPDVPNDENSNGRIIHGTEVTFGF